MEQKLADRELTADLQMLGLTELNRRLLSRTEQIEQTMGKRNEENTSRAARRAAKRRTSRWPPRRSSRKRRCSDAMI